jgi:hypothetical protein
MSWLDANEVFLMEVVTRDRIDDLRSSVDLATASAPRIDRDGALLETLRRRDPTAAERLVARYGGRAYRLAIRITRDAADAEEVVQDAFWSVIRKIARFAVMPPSGRGSTGSSRTPPARSCGALPTIGPRSRWRRCCRRSTRTLTLRRRSTTGRSVSTILRSGATCALR